jgi:hypothetical protein
MLAVAAVGEARANGSGRLVGWGENVVGQAGVGAADAGGASRHCALAVAQTVQ